MYPTPEELAKALQAAIAGLTPETHGNERHYVLRAAYGQFPVEWRLRATATRAKPVQVEGVEARAAGTPPEKGDRVQIKGCASSTSVDWHETEMSPRCLQDMGGQFNEGVGVYPSHGGGWFGPPLNWDEELGTTSAAEMERGNVANPADATEPGWLLNVTMDLDAVDTKVQELVRRLDNGQIIGLSIGGWFTEIRYICNDDGELIRVIVEKVMLDHLAVVRSPSCPDCLGLEVLRSAGVAAMAARLAPPVAAKTEEPAPVVAAPAPVPAARTAPSPAAEEGANPAEVTPPAVVDNRSEGSDDKPADATPPEDFHMTEEQFRQMLLEALSPVTKRLDDLDARAAAAPPAAKPETPEERILALQAQLERQKQITEALISQPQRSGGSASSALAASNDPLFSASEMGAAIQRVKDAGPDHAPALAAAAKRHQPFLMVEFRSKGAKGELLRSACEGAGGMLQDLLRAAHADGTLRQWRILHADLD